MLASGMSQEIPQVSPKKPRKKTQKQKAIQNYQGSQQNPKKVPKKASKSSKKAHKIFKESLTNNFCFSHHPEQMIYISQEDCILQTPKNPRASSTNTLKGARKERW